MAYKQPYTQAYPSYNNPGYYEADSNNSPMQNGADYNGAYHTDKFGMPYQNDSAATTSGSKWNPKSWSKRTRIIAGIVTAVVVIIVVVVAAVEGTKANAYPNYSALSYSLDTSSKYHSCARE